MFYKISVSIGLFFVSLACATYTWNTYQRYAHELEAWDNCKQIVAAQFRDSKTFTSVEESVLAWTTINKCAIMGTY